MNGLIESLESNLGRPLKTGSATVYVTGTGDGREGDLIHFPDGTKPVVNERRVKKVIMDWCEGERTRHGLDALITTIIHASVGPDGEPQKGEAS